MSNEVKKVEFYADKLRAVCGNDMKVTKVFPAYRAGFDPQSNRMRQFYYFPVDERLVITANDESTKARKNEAKKELREKVWNKDAKTMEFHRVNAKLDGEWFKTFKKTFDIDVEFANPVNLKNWKNPEGIDVTTARVPVNASHIKTMLETYTDEADAIKLIPGKDKAGKPAMVKPFDWEDALAEKLVGIFCHTKVTGEGMDTKYIWKPAAPFTTKAEAEAVFGDAPSKEQKHRTGEPTEQEIQDLPF
jgi:hypothetical protein